MSSKCLKINCKFYPCNAVGVAPRLECSYFSASPKSCHNCEKYSYNNYCEEPGAKSKDSKGNCSNWSKVEYSREVMAIRKKM